MQTTYRIKRWSETFENHKTRTKPAMRMQRLQSPIDFLGIGYGRLTAMEDREALYGCWTVTAMVAAQCQPRGVLVRNDGSPHTPLTVALIARFRPKVMEMAWEAFKEIGWLLPAEGDFNPPVSTPRPSTAPPAPPARPSSAPKASLDRPGRDWGAPILDPDPDLDPEMDPPLSPPRGGRGCGSSGKPVDKIGFCPPEPPESPPGSSTTRKRRRRQPRGPRTGSCGTCEGGRLYTGTGFGRRIHRTCECPEGKALKAALKADQGATKRAQREKAALEAGRPEFLRRRSTRGIQDLAEVIPEIIGEIEPEEDA